MSGDARFDRREFLKASTQTRAGFAELSGIDFLSVRRRQMRVLWSVLIGEGQQAHLDEEKPAGAGVQIRLPADGVRPLRLSG